MNLFAFQRCTFAIQRIHKFNWDTFFCNTNHIPSSESSVEGKRETYIFVTISIKWISLVFIMISFSHIGVDELSHLSNVSYFHSDKFRICDDFNIIDFFGLHHDFLLSYWSRRSKPSAQCHPFPLSSLQPKCLPHGYLMTRPAPSSPYPSTQDGRVKNETHG